MKMPQETVVTLLESIDTIESHLDQMGWTKQRLEPFTMTFLGRLRHSLLPELRARLAGVDPLPPESSLGVMAVREFDGQDEFGPLTQMLSLFDYTYNQVRRVFPD